MKRNVITVLGSLLMLLMTSVSALGQQCSYILTGQVTNATTGALVSGQTVSLLLDPAIWGPNNTITATTSPNGSYHFTVPVACNSTANFVLTVQGCGVTTSTNVTATPNAQTYVNNFAICGNPPPCPQVFVSTWYNGGLMIGFSNSNQTAISYSWNMGDGFTYTWPQGVHTYAVAGTYTVCHQAVYANNCVFDTCFTVTVANPVQCSVEAIVSGSANSNTVQFTYQDSLAPGVTPVSVFWDMGNGYQTNNYPNGGSYTYPNPGTYTACVTVVYSNGCSATDCQSVTVGQNTGCPYIISGVVTNGQTGLPVTSQVVTVNTSYGTYSAQTNPNGYYIITFVGPCNTAFNAPISTSGCGISYNNIINVTPNSNTYTQNFTICGGGNPTDSCYAVVTANSVGNIVSFQWSGGSSQGSTFQSVWWDFGNGVTSNNYPNGGTYTYPTNGTYSICATITYASGCVTTACYTITVGQNTNQPICGCVTYLAANTGAVANVGCGMAYLIQLNNANSVSIIDSAVITPNGYCFSGNFNGNYTVYAVPCAGAMVNNGVLPTYLGNVLFWNNAIAATPGNFQANCIQLAGAQSSQGPGQISGNIIWGEDKDIGDPVVGVKVLLLDLDANPIAMAVTDDEGFYSFTNLAYGTYRVYPEVPGLITYPILVAVSPEVEHFDYANFSLGFGIFTGVEELSLTEVRIFPNPASEYIQAAFKTEHAGELQIVIHDMSGRMVFSQNQVVPQGDSVLMLDIQSLKSGIYTLRISQNNLQSNHKFIKR